MKVTLLEHTPEPEKVIAERASICYESDCTPAKNGLRIQKLVEMGHWSPLRFANATFKISDVSLVESHQQVRVAHAGILQKSHRYVKLNELRVIRPPSFSNASNSTIKKLQFAEQLAFQAYTELMEEGIPKEDARYVLPQGITTELLMTGNFQMWINWIQARTSQHAQWEIRAVATEINNQLSVLAPTIFKAI